MSQLDVAFCCDCTGSMGSYIRSAQENIRNIASGILQHCQSGTSIRFALVKYRDHPPQDSSYVTEVFPFTEKIEVMKRNVDTMSANGGGDGPEAVAAALKELRDLEWRPNATKVAVLIADAPPHGLGESGDGFPNGCPQGNDPIQICKQMAAMGVIIYVAGVEPILSTSYKYARDFMMAVAKITDGKFLPLGRAGILAEVIVHGALEGVNMKELWEKAEKEVAESAAKTGEHLKTEELVKRVEVRISEVQKEVKVAKVEVENPYLENYDYSNCDRFMQNDNLSGARAKLDAKINVSVPQQSAGYQWGQQQAFAAPAAPMSCEQQSRCVAFGKRSKGF
jgi:Mg-chelatase subunit ChlD